MKLICFLSSFFFSQLIMAAPWKGYPFLVQTPYAGGGLANSSRSESFLMIVADDESPEIRPHPVFRQMLTELTGVCDDRDELNVSCQEWVNGETYLILKKLDLTKLPERADFLLVTTPPKSLIDDCANIEEDQAPCIAQFYPRRSRTPRGQKRRDIASQIYAVYPNHGPRNPIAFSLYANLSLQKDQIVFEGFGPSESPIAKTAKIRVAFKPVRNNAPIVDSEEAVGRFLRFGQEIEEIELSLDYRDKPLVRGHSLRCDLEECGMSVTARPKNPNEQM